MPRQTTRSKKSQGDRAAYKARRKPVAAATASANSSAPGNATASQMPSSPTAGATILSLDRNREYAFIRADLKRMIITAGLLLGLMIALLFVIEQ